MARWSELTPEQQAAVDKLHDAIAECEESLGPRADPEFLAESEEEGESAPSEPMLLSEWVLLVAWSDVATGELWKTRTCSPHLPRHHQQGLMNEFID